MNHLNKPHKAKWETFVMDNAQLIFPAEVMAKTVTKTVCCKIKTISCDKPKQF